MEEPASRQFYSLPEATDYLSHESESTGLEPPPPLSDDAGTHVKVKQEDNLLSYVADNVIGSDKIFSGPYGLRTAVYLDFTASGSLLGRYLLPPYKVDVTINEPGSLQFIEDYIQQEVLPEYGNTHTTTSITSLQTTLFRHEARDIVRNSCNASEHDSVIFVGSGTTGAVHKLIHSLNFTDSPIVFVGPHEHHSNILPWVEMGAEVIRISSTKLDTVDIGQLENYLKMLKPFGRQMVGAFSAASNVTGVMAHVDAITITLHKHGALAFWDYAAAAPYVRVDMNPYIGGDQQDLVYKDAVYFSVHKFVGGVGCPGVLIMKKKLFKNPVPHGCGGGTVFFVRREHHRYLVEPEMKEEGGTPDIVGSIRAGLVFQLRDAIGPALIASQDDQLLRRAINVWQGCPQLVLLGPNPGTAERLPIVSFLVHHPITGLFLHHNFVTAVLNDVFGIQARGGCACAGPYAMDILGMTEIVSKKMEELLAEDSRLDRVHLRRIGEYSHREIIRPGFVRINLPYFMDIDQVDFVIEAVQLVSQHAWKLLPQYLFNPETGEWRNRNFQTFKDRKWLGHISYSQGRMSYHQPAQVVKGPLPSNHRDCLDKAKEIFHQAGKISLKLPDQSVMFDDLARSFRWFLLPSEANACLQNKWKNQPLSPTQLPFCPPSLLKLTGHVWPGLEFKSSQDKINEAVERIKKRKEKCEAEKVLGSKRVDVVGSLEYSGEEQSGSCKGFDSTLQETNSSSVNVLNVLERGFVLDEASGALENSHCEIDEDRGDLQGNVRTEGVDVSGLLDKMVGSLSISGKVQNNLEQFDEGAGIVCSGSKDKVMKTGLNPFEENKTVRGDGVTNCDSVCSEGGSCDSPSDKRNRVVEGEGSNGNKSSGGGSSPNTSRNGSSCGACCQVKNKERHHDSLETSKGDRGNGWFAPPKSIFKPAYQALKEYKMIQDGDRVLVCLSGGKDSLSLLHFLKQFQFFVKRKQVDFTIGAVTVDPQTPSYDPSPLKKYLAHLGVPYFYESQCIMETANNLPYDCASICSFCSRMKRGRIYAAARREGYNVLAMGQHLDDLAESFLMSFLHNGSLNTMKAHYTVKEGDLRVIRPFVYVRETELRNFAEQNNLPVISENCPACFDAPKERHRTKQLLAAQEVMFPQVYSSMMAALKPLMARERKSGVLTGSRSKVTDTEGKGDDNDDIDL